MIVKALELLDPLRESTLHKHAVDAVLRAQRDGGDEAALDKARDIREKFDDVRLAERLGV